MRNVTAFCAFLTLCAPLLAGGADQAAALLKKGEAKKAIEAARKLVDKDAANIDAWVVLADAMILAGEPADAWTAIEEAMEKNPAEARLSVKLGDVFIKMAEKEQAGGGDGTTITNYYLDAERQYHEGCKKDPKSADALYGRAYANYMLNREETKKLARELLDQALAIDPKHGKTHALRGQMLYGEARSIQDAATRTAMYNKAQQEFKLALEADDSDPITFVRYGHTFYAQKKNEEAKKAYIAALKRHPNNPVPILSGLVYLVDPVKDYRKLAPILEEATKEAPDSAPAWYYLGYSYFVNNRFEDALKAYGKAVALDKQNASYVYGVGYAYEKLGKEKKALDCYREALQLYPNHPQAAGRFYALALARQNDIGYAEKYFEELLKLAPNIGYIHNDYALLLRDWAERRGAARDKNPKGDVKRRIQRSAEVYELAAAIDPDVAQIQSDTGLLFEYYPCTFDAKKARAYFIRALELSDFVYRDAFDGLNRLCRRTKDWETLEEYAERVLGSIERGNNAIAPVGGGAPQVLANETPGLKARAEAALKLARQNLKKQ